MSSILTQHQELTLRISDLLQKVTDTGTVSTVDVDRERRLQDNTDIHATGHRILATIPPGQAVQLIVSQIPEFAGTDEENVRQWTSRVDKVAAIHGALDDVVLLAASSKLTKSAKRWYEQQDTACCESWPALKEGLTRFFDRSVPYSTALKKVEARKWDSAKESFDEYALDKLSLMYRLNLQDDDEISLLAAGITNMSLRAIALSEKDTNLNQFLDRMRRITQGLTLSELKPTPCKGSSGSSEETCRNCDKRGHTAKQCTSPEIRCFYCREMGHQKWDCLKLKKRNEQLSTSYQGATSPAAATSGSTLPSTSSQRFVATVNTNDTLRVKSPLVRITRLNDIPIEIEALIDTGSPVSFIKRATYEKFFGPCSDKIVDAGEKYTAINNNPLDVVGTVKASIQLQQLPRTLQV